MVKPYARAYPTILERHRDADLNVPSVLNALSTGPVSTRNVLTHVPEPVVKMPVATFSTTVLYAVVIQVTLVILSPDVIRFLVSRNILIHNRRIYKEPFLYIFNCLQLPHLCNRNLLTHVYLHLADLIQYVRVTAIHRPVRVK